MCVGDILSLSLSLFSFLPFFFSFFFFFFAIGVHTMTEPPQQQPDSSSGVARRRGGDEAGAAPVPPLNAPGPGARRWNAESRWRAFLRPSDYRTPGSFDEASERFSLNLPYYLSQYAAIGVLTVLGGALLSGGVTFVLAVVVALLLVIIAISLTSRIELANSTRFLVFLLVTIRLSPASLSPHTSLHLSRARTHAVVSVVFWFTEDMRLGSQCFIIWFSSLLLPTLLPLCVPSPPLQSPRASLYPAQCVQDALGERADHLLQHAAQVSVPTPPAATATTHSAATYPPSKCNPQQNGRNTAQSQCRWRYSIGRDICGHEREWENGLRSSGRDGEKGFEGTQNSSSSATLSHCRYRHRLRSGAGRARRRAARAAAATRRTTA